MTLALRHSIICCCIFDIICCILLRSNFSSVASSLRLLCPAICFFPLLQYMCELALCIFHTCIDVLYCDNERQRGKIDYFHQAAKCLS
jgi:hypothetical protein